MKYQGKWLLNSVYNLFIALRLLSAICFIVASLQKSWFVMCTWLESRNRRGAAAYGAVVQITLNKCFVKCWEICISLHICRQSMNAAT
uniref:Hypothetical secreted protein 1819 n=1 Tax=Amblyomma variegatum TaxID=34610 RepID=F0J9Z2_AMBVA|nr:TPA_inf: hypothetical secreted protein 1819 [Amblyomma variegatum]